MGDNEGEMDMKTLILNGSPRKNGDTAFLQQEFLAHLKGEYGVIHAYDGKIRAAAFRTGCRNFMNKSRKRIIS